MNVEACELRERKGRERERLGGIHWNKEGLVKLGLGYLNLFGGSNGHVECFLANATLSIIIIVRMSILQVHQVPSTSLSNFYY